MTERWCTSTNFTDFCELCGLKKEELVVSKAAWGRCVYVSLDLIAIMMVVNGFLLLQADASRARAARLLGLPKVVARRRLDRTHDSHL